MVVFAFGLPKGASIVPRRTGRNDDAHETASPHAFPSKNAPRGPSIKLIADEFEAHDGPHILGKKYLFMRIAALEEPDAVKVLGGRAAHIHRVFGKINVAVGRDAEGGRPPQCRALRGRLHT